MVSAKKKAFEIEIPLLGTTTYALSAEKDALIGRIMKIDLTRTLKGKNIEANLKIGKDDDKLIACFVSIYLLPSFIRRMTRKGISWIEDSFVCEGKEGKIAIKPFMLTRKKIHRSVKKAIRNKAKEIIIESIKGKSNEEIFDSILSGQIQKEISSQVKKIYPLSLCEIRMAKLK